MKFPNKIFLLLLMGLYACSTEPNSPQVEPEKVEYENQFFTLDFQNDNSNLSTFETHFLSTFPHNDPTLGNVVYDRAKWTQEDMIQVQENDGLYAYVKFREDSTGFDSFRFTTKTFFNLTEETPRLLFVYKGSLPSEKGMWPAWWLNGSKQPTWIYQDSVPAQTDEKLNRYSGKGNYYDTSSSVNSTDWPGGGEIDIIENINGDPLIHNTLHTCPQMCDSEWNGEGTQINCANAKPNDVNPGCSGSTYEVEKLAGTFACIWEKSTIRFYYWAPEAPVGDAGGPLSAQPQPDSWTGDELKNTVTLLETDAGCDDSLHQDWQCKNCAGSNSCQFQNMKMIFNVTLCGAWAGNQFDDTDNSLNNCEAFIRGEGASLIDNQFMKIEYVSVRPI